MKTGILNSPIGDFQVHPEVNKIYRQKNLDGMTYTMSKYGQQKPALVVERKGKL